MNKMIINWRILPICVFLGLVLFLGRGLFLEPQIIPSAQIGKYLPNFVLPDLLDPKKKLTNISFKNQVTLLNVWASWCSACNREQLLLIKLAEQGVIIYGLNYQDEPNSAKKWLELWGNPYKKIAVDAEGNTSMDLGVYGAPETFLIDKKGVIRYKHVGILTEEIWKNKLSPLKKILESEAL